MFHDRNVRHGSKIQGRAREAQEQNFSAFVKGERDLVGLVAFALHERQVREWRMEMQRTCGRLPTEDEIRAHRLGETTPNSIVAYRFLAAESLAGRGSDAAQRPAYSSDPAFPLFCASEYDFVGIVAFAIHEQQTRQWREAVRKTCGRAPTEDEERAHQISETTPRRILGYRFLAGERLAGRGPDLTPGAAKVSFIIRTLGGGARRSIRAPGRWRGWRLLGA